MWPTHPDPVTLGIAQAVAEQTGYPPGRLPYLRAFRDAYIAAAPPSPGLAEYLSTLDVEIHTRTPQEGRFFGRDGQLMRWLRG